MRREHPQDLYAECRVVSGTATFEEVFERILFVFVLETIRTSAMHVIHIPVKTEEDAETAH